VLEEHPYLAHTLVLIQFEHLALGRRQAVLDGRDECVGTGVVAACLGRAAAEQLLIEPHHRVGELLELQPLAVRMADTWLLRLVC
jgi:hypothetical protein